MRDFGKWLRETRIQRGMTQARLAQFIGVTDSYVSLLEVQKALTEQGSPIRPSLHLVDAIAWTLGKSCEEARLAAGYAPPETPPSALHKLSLMEMFLRLPPHVQEDVNAQVEGIYLKYHARRIKDSAKGRATQNSTTSDTRNEASQEGSNDKTTTH